MDGHQHQRQEHQQEHRRKHHRSEPRRRPQEHVIESENEKIYWKYLNQIN